MLEVHGIFPKSYLPSLATSCENMASNSQRIMEKSRNFQIVYAGRTNLSKHCTTDLARGIMKQWGRPTTLSYCRGPILLSLPLGTSQGGNDQLCLESAAVGYCLSTEATGAVVQALTINYVSP